MTTDIFIQHVVGRCPVCGCPMLDCGYSDDPQLWEHSLPCKAFERNQHG